MVEFVTRINGERDFEVLIRTNDCNTYLDAQECARSLVDSKRTGLTPERCAELAQADAEGRLVVFPCKVGDTVWVHSYIRSGDAALGIQPHTVTNTNAYLVVHGEANDIGIPVKQCGKTWFLTREEAEQALKEAE